MRTQYSFTQIDEERTVFTTRSAATRAFNAFYSYAEFCASFDVWSQDDGFVVRIYAPGVDGWLARQ
jgi:hypothetical protein